MVVPKCNTRAAALAVLKDVFRTLGIKWDWIDVDATHHRRESSDGNTNRQLCAYVGVSALLPNDHGARVHTVIKESAPRFPQAVARIVARLSDIMEREADDTVN
jgi:hypothetical protein